MNVVHLGALRLELDEGDAALDVLTGLLRHLNNKEVGRLLGISERTVRRWKLSGRLPSKDNEQISLLELLLHLAGADDDQGLNIARQAAQTAGL
ncbi:MAG: hypothetical protein HY342_12235 [Candidatus Lambdaproteobacteria bacterium]|nr:hypothetical protein [Candidatus Lambdaproteobacteria bacterium]